MSDVLEAVYGTFAISWPSGEEGRREGLTHEALHLAEILAGLAPDVGETHGLAALICLSAARMPARRDRHGDFVPLGEQDTTLWDATLIDRGRAHLAAAHGTAEVDGAAAGLALLDDLGEAAATFQPAWATRAHLLASLGRTAEARRAFGTAIELTTDSAERHHLTSRQAALE